MFGYLVNVLLQILILESLLCLASSSGNCSCYTFHYTRENWQTSNKLCGSRKGLLVSIETENEWRFINSEIQKRNNGHHNEWYIGLKIHATEVQNKIFVKRRKAAWKWTSGQPYTDYNKWQTFEPNGGTADVENTYFCGVIAKEWPKGTYGHFKDVNCVIQRPYICEYDEGILVQSSQVCWNVYTNKSAPLCSQTIPTTKRTTTLPAMSQSSERTQSLTRELVSTKTTMIPTEYIPATPTKHGKAETEGKPADSQSESKTKPFDTIFILVIVLAAILVILVCVFVLFYCNSKRKPGSCSETDERSTRTQVTAVNSPISSNGTHLTGPDNVIYAEANNDTNLNSCSANTDVNNGITVNPAYNEEQLYLCPVDVNELPPPTPTPQEDYLYSTIDETCAHKKENNTYEDVISNDLLSVEESALKSSHPVYEEVNKPKQTEGKKARAGSARDENAEKKRDVSDPNISSTGPAVYAAIDKSKKKKSKKAAVGIATEASNTNYHDSQKPPALPAVYIAIELPNKKQEQTRSGFNSATDIVEANANKFPSTTSENQISSPPVYPSVNKSQKSPCNNAGAVIPIKENKAGLTEDLEDSYAYETNDNQTYKNTNCSSQDYEQLATENKLLFEELNDSQRRAEEHDEKFPEIPPCHVYECVNK